MSYEMTLISSFYIPSSTFHKKKCFLNPTSTSASISICRLLVKPIDEDAASSNAVRLWNPCTVKSRSFVIVNASSDNDGTGGTSSDVVPPAMSVESLPLETKLQEKIDQKLRMKLAKKIRLRRKRLVRKRQLRKKGRWPPSKMNKLKNV